MTSQLNLHRQLVSSINYELVILLFLLVNYKRVVTLSIFGAGHMVHVHGHILLNRKGPHPSYDRLQRYYTSVSVDRSYFEETSNHAGTTGTIHTLKKKKIAGRWGAGQERWQSVRLQSF